MARRPGVRDEDVGEAVAGAGDVGHPDRAVDACGQEFGGGFAVGQCARVGRAGGCQYDGVHAGQVAETVSEDLDQHGIRSKSTGRVDLPGVAPRFRRNVDVHVIARTQQQRYDDSVRGITGDATNKRRKRRRQQIDKPQRNRQIRPLTSHLPNQLVHNPDPTRIRRTMGHRNKISHVGTPAGSTANR